LARISTGKTVAHYGAADVIFMQGESADSLYFLSQGTVRLSVTTDDGKEAIVATQMPGDVFGEGCLAHQPFHMATAIAAEACTVTRVDKRAMARLLHDDPALADMLVSHLASRISRYEADLADQLFNSSEKRLARLLLLLSRYGEDSRSEAVVAGVNQEQLAQMVGTTRSRVNVFMNRFRKRGFIDYHGVDGVIVHRGLCKVLSQPNVR
jgi:CRP-like cAMP-binding protein